MEGLGAYCQFHADVSVHRGRAIVLCGASEAGKTSLVVGLALAGADFYSDKVAVFDPERFDVHPFRRALIVHRGTQKLFPELETNLPAWKVFPDYCYVPPRAVGASAALVCAWADRGRRALAGAVIQSLGSGRGCDRGDRAVGGDLSRPRIGFWRRA